MQTDWNRKQKTARLEREIAHFNAQIERFSNPQNPREKAALTRLVVTNLNMILKNCLKDSVKSGGAPEQYIITDIRISVEI